MGLDANPISFYTAEGLRLDAQLRGEPLQPLVIMCHGLASSKECPTFSDLEAMLPDMATLRFDFHAHGKSDTADLSMTRAVTDVESAIAYARQQGFRDIGLFGSSFGAKAALHAAARAPVDYLALKCPVASYHKDDLGPRGKYMVGQLLQHGQFDYPSKPPMRIKRSFYDDALQHDGYAAADHILSPTLMVHGDCDSIVPVQQCLELKNHLADCRIFITPGADHEFATEQHYKEMLGQVASFINMYSRKR